MIIVHSADWHFNEKNHDEVKKCLDYMITYMGGYSRQDKIDLILISGDITDSRYLNLDSKSARTIFNLVNQMLDIAPVAIVTGTSSHDGKAALALRECRGKYPVLVSDMPGQYVYGNDVWCLPENYDFDVPPEFVLTQIPQPTKQYFISSLGIEDSDKAISEAMNSILASFGRIPEYWDGLPIIVNGHFQVGGAFISETQQLIGRDIELSRSQLTMLNADLICLGHIHKSQHMGDSVFYSGSPTRMNFGEKEEKGFYVHRLNGAQDIYDFIQTPVRMKLEIKEDFTGSEPNEIDIVLNTYGPEEIKDADLKITLTMWQDEAQIINQAELKQSYLDAGCNSVKLSLIRKPRETVRAEKVLNAESLPDKLEAMAELRGEEISDSILEKSASLEAGEDEPWKTLDTIN